MERKKIPSKKRNNKNAWFDIECRQSKRKVTKLAKRYSKCPPNSSIRDEYYNQRKEYRKLLKLKESSFYVDLNSQIEEGKDINWECFKKLKYNNNDEDALDLFDLANFFNFFKELYSEKKSLIRKNNSTDISY